MSFRLKIVLGIALIEVILLSILVVSGLRYLQESNETQLVNRAQTTAQLFATMISDAVISMDIATIDEMIAKTLTTKEITYIRVIHAGGSIISEGGKEEHLEEQRGDANDRPDQQLHGVIQAIAEQHQGQCHQHQLHQNR